jgi:hypothetical protein
MNLDLKAQPKELNITAAKKVELLVVEKVM